MGRPPSSADAPNVTVTAPTPAVAVTEDGAPGGPTGVVTGSDDADAAPDPTALVAETLKL